MTAAAPDAIVSREEKLEFSFHNIADLATLDIRPDFLIRGLTNWYESKAKLLSAEKLCQFRGNW